MKVLVYDPIGLLGLGFIIGFVIILITYFVAHFSGKEITGIKKSLLIIGTLLIVIYTPPIKGVSKVWLIVSLLLLTYVINSILQTLYHLSITFYDRYMSLEKLNRFSQILYVVAILIATILILTASQGVIVVAYYLIKQLILLSIGVWLALRLLYNKPTYEQNN